MRLLAEFAAESENEGALEARRVQTLTLVVTSYAPLIYDLKKDAGLNDLIHQAEAVCACLNNNPTLPERIVINYNLSPNYDKNIILFLFLVSNCKRENVARRHQRFQRQYKC